MTMMTLVKPLLFALILSLSFIVIQARPIVRAIKSTHEFDRLLEKHAAETGLPVIADFYSDGCGPCRMMAPIFKKLAKEKADSAVFVKIDTNAQHQLAGRYSVRSIPTFVFFHNGKKVNEFSGAGEGQLRQFTDMVIGQAKDENVKLKSENLIAFYDSHESTKTSEEINSIMSKCAGSKSGGEVHECVGAPAFKLSRKLKKKYGKGPKLVPRFDPVSSTTESSPERRAKKQDESKSKTKEGLVNKPNLHLATLDQLQAEVERRLDEIRDAEVDDEDDEDAFDEDAHSFKRGPFPQPVTIIGGGPAGLSAAIYAARSGLKPVVIAPPMGGQLLGKGVDVENYPGMFNVTGPEVVASMRAQAIEFGTTFEADIVTKIDASPNGPFKVFVNESDTPIETHSIIVATGAESKWLGIPGEYELRGGGVSSCAICDGSIYASKDVIIVGGGDAAMEDALVLARTSKSVTVVHRRGKFRASKILAQRVMEHPLIKINWNTVVTEIIGENVDESKKVVKTAVLMNTITNENERLPIDAVFVAIGHTPATEFLNGIVQYNEDNPGYVMTYNETTKTSIAGIFAAGDVSDAVYRQAITSAGSGAAAALDAERWLSEMGLGNEEAELEASLMAEMMAEPQETKEAYNAYSDSSASKTRKTKKTKEKRIDEDELVLEL